MKKYLSLLLVLSLSALHTGCVSPRQIMFSMGYMFNKPEADYDALELAESGRVVTAHVDKEPYWIAYRGPKTNGIYEEQPINLDWPKGGLQAKWRFPIGAGFGSFVVAEGMAFTLEQRRGNEALVAYDLETGTQIWKHEYEGRFHEAMSGEGPRGTPTYHDGRVFSVGSMGTLCCVRAATGEPVWQRNVLTDAEAENLEYGLSASPVIVGNNVIALAGESKGSKTVRAYSITDGSLAWSSLKDKQGYSTPQRMTLAGQDQLVVCTGNRIAGLNPLNGEVLWTFDWQVLGGLISSQPVQVDADRFVVSGGYGKGTTLIEITRSGDRHTATEVWSSRRLNANFSTPVVHKGFVYGLDGGILTCLNLADGKRVWKSGRFGFGQMLKVGNRLLISAEKGDLLVVALNPDALEVVSRFAAIEGKTLNNPALAHGFLLLRNSAERVCYDLNP